MFIATIPNRNSPPAILLRQGYRAEGKVKTRTLANLTHWRAERIEALRRALKGDFDGLVGEGDPMSGPVFGVLFALKCLADALGITQALGRKAIAKQALFLVIARIAHGGSRLSAVRWAAQQAVEDVLGVSGFDEEDLYRALDWLAAQQARIEKRLYQHYLKRSGQPPVLVLYDVTSSYLEGTQNELAAYGYNRDGKRGKQQIVIGLMTAPDGEPLAVRVFEGNTADPSTVSDQITLLKTQFGIEEVVLVGDRGMIKSKAKAALAHTEGFKYITALTNPQIRALLKKDVLQMELFDTGLCELEHAGKRLILYRNEAIQAREQARREDKLACLAEKIDQRNDFVGQSKRANPQAGLRQLQHWLKRHKLSAFVDLTLNERRIEYCPDEAGMRQATLLDGCYVLETDVHPQHMNTKTIDARYRDLQKVERNFRTLKTDFLEVRPIFLRKANRTQAHVFVAMLALKITRLFEQKIHPTFGTTDQDPKALTLEDALTALSRITYLHYQVNDQTFARLPRLDETQTAIFDALGISFPKSTAKAA
jgi:transposase